MPTMVVRGLPKEKSGKLQKLIFKLYIRKAGVTDFYIEKVVMRPDTKLKEATIKIISMEDTLKVEELIKRRPYWQENVPHYLKVHTVNYDSGKLNTQMQASSSNQNKSEIDMEIEILRKQRQVIEEKKKILTETEKLELMREYGPDAPMDVDDEMPRELEMQRPRERVPPPPRKVELPLFVLPCKLIMRSMNKFIRKKAKTKLEKDLASRLIHARLRRSIALALQNCSYLSGHEIVELFREQHPVEDDDDFVKNIIKDIRQCQWPKRNLVKKLQAKLNKSKNEQGNAGATSATVVVKEESQIDATQASDKKDDAIESAEGITSTDVNQSKSIETSNETESTVLEEPSKLAEEAEQANEVTTEESTSIEEVEQTTSSDLEPPTVVEQLQQINVEEPVPPEVDQLNPTVEVDQSKSTDVEESTSAPGVEQSTPTDLVEQSEDVVEDPKSTDEMNDLTVNLESEPSDVDHTDQFDAADLADADEDWAVDGDDWNDGDEQQ